MEILTIFLIIILIGFFIWDRFRANQRWKEQSAALSKVVGEKVAGSVGVLGDVRERLGELTKRTEDIEEVGKNIASLQEALRAPKFRGGFGELGLERLLADCLPSDFYSIQYRFHDGETVDAVVKVGANLVPIDAKFPFPLDDFRKMVNAESPEEQLPLQKEFVRTIKKHVDNVSKYIRPDEKTFDFALMYIPAENIYYETIVQSQAQEQDLCSYCVQKRVFPVSPNSFYAYLQAITLGLRGLQVEKSAREILGQLQRLQSAIQDFQNDYEVVGRHITNAARKHAEANAKLTKLSDRLESLTGSDQTKNPPNGDSKD